MASSGHIVETEVFCVYDMSDDVIIVQGTFIEMEDLLDTMAGNLIIAPIENIEKYKNSLGNNR
jgi:hypothetical protein